MTCDSCGSKLFQKSSDKYNNVYGHICSKCGFFIKPAKEPQIIKINRQRYNILKNKVLEKIKNQLKGENNGN